MELSKIERQNIQIGKLILFFIHPFLAFLLAIKNLKSKFSFTIIFLFNILFGYTFIAQNIEADSYYYVEEFNKYKNITTDRFLIEIKDYFTFDSYFKDIYGICSYYIVSRISKNYHILMAFWALIFSYFFLKSLRFFVERPEFKKSLVVSFLAFLFIFSNNIFNINGVRFWTAAWVGVYVIFEIIINKNHRYILLALITPFIHISYIVFVAVLILYIFSTKYDKFWLIIFFISFFISEMSILFIQNYSSFAPTAMQNIIWSYTHESNLQYRQDIINDLPLYAKILNLLPRYFINSLMIIFIFNNRYIKSNPGAKAVYLFLLVWLSFSNFTMAIPSFGSRFIALSVPFITYLCLLMYSKISLLTKFIYLIPLIYSYTILYWIRNLISVTDPFLLISFFPHIIIKNL